MVRDRLQRGGDVWRQVAERQHDRIGVKVATIRQTNAVAVNSLLHGESVRRDEIKPSGR